MKITVPVADLKAALAQISWAATNRPTLPFLQCVHLVVKNARLYMACTDLDVYAHTWLKGVKDQAGEAIVSVKALQEMVKGAVNGTTATLLYKPAKKIKIKPSDLKTQPAGRLEFTLSDGLQSSLETFGVDKYPVLSTKDRDCDASIKMTAGEFRSAVDRVAFAISTEETRYYLTGICCETWDTNKLKLIATNGHSMSILTLPPNETATGVFGSSILPTCAIRGIQRVFAGNNKTPLSIELFKPVAPKTGCVMFFFKAGALTIISKGIDGTFPDYTRVIPAGTPAGSIIVKRIALLSCVKRGIDLQQESAPALRLTPINTPKETALGISVSSLKHGCTTQQISASIGGKPSEFGVNGHYLSDICKSFFGEELRMEMQTGADPIIIRDVGHDAVMVILMPMRV